MHPYFTICLNMSLWLIVRPFWVPSFHHTSTTYIYILTVCPFIMSKGFQTLMRLDFIIFYKIYFFLIIWYFESIKLCLKLNYYTPKMWISYKMDNRYQWQLKKIKILGAVLELPAKHHCGFGKF